MMEDRRADARDAIEAARREAIVNLPPSTWREIQGRAATLGLGAELTDEGQTLRLVIDVAPVGAPAAGRLTGGRVGVARASSSTG